MNIYGSLMKIFDQKTFMNIFDQKTLMDIFDQKHSWTFLTKTKREAQI